MLILFSSATRKRYKEDVLRALAMPNGTYLAFRYKHKWLSHNLIADFEGNGLGGERGLIAYLDAPSATHPFSTVPCRLIKIVTTESVGTMCTVTMELGSFAYCKDKSQWNSEILKIAPGHPKLVDGTLRGFYSEALTSEPRSVAYFDTVDTWEKVITDLFKYEAFASENFFYLVTGIKKSGCKSYESPKNGQFKLKASFEYAIPIVHYYPGHKPAMGAGDSTSEHSLRIVTNDESICLTSTGTLLIDSPYDKKTVRFRTKRLQENRHGVISCVEIKGDGPSVTEHGQRCLCELDVEIRYSKSRAIFLICVLTLTLSLEGILIFSEKIHAKLGTLLIVACIVGLSLLTSATAVLGLRKEV